MTYLLHGLDAVAPDEFVDLVPGVLARSRLFSISLEDRLHFLEGVLREFKSLTRLQLTSAYVSGPARVD